MRQLLINNCIVVILVLLLGACGGEEEPVASVTEPDKSENNTSPKAQVSKGSTSSQSSDMCSLVSPEDVSSALGGKLPLGSAKTSDTGCEYPVRFGIDGNNVSYRLTSLAQYDSYKNWEKQGGVEFEYIHGLGKEAFIINNAQICILINDNEALVVSAQVIAIMEKLPITQDEIKAGLMEIARKVEAGF